MLGLQPRGLQHAGKNYFDRFGHRKHFFGGMNTCGYARASIYSLFSLFLTYTDTHSENDLISSLMSGERKGIERKDVLTLFLTM